jgi:magnesium-transporting ATPase (P-type)
VSDWYKGDAEGVVQQLGTDTVHGLHTAEATRRLAEYGPNELQEPGRKRPWQIFWEPPCLAKPPFLRPSPSSNL